MLHTVLVMAGGAIGAALRFHLGKAAGRTLGHDWPWGTLGANVIGGIAMGLFAGWLAARSDGGESLRLFVAVGLLGGFTTFSAFSLETLLMIERGETVSAILYVSTSVLLSVGGLAAGLAVMRAAGA